MITTAELKSLKTLHEELGKLLPRIDAIAHSCQHCAHRDVATCDIYGVIPAGMSMVENECDKWELIDIPF